MRIAIAKLNNTNTIPQLIYVFYNAYMIKSIYFGCGILKLTPTQEAILIWIYELTLLQKLGLSIKFSRSVLYIRKSVVGIGIIKPSTIIDILALKLYIGHKHQ